MSDADAHPHGLGMRRPREAVIDRGGYALSVACQQHVWRRAQKSQKVVATAKALTRSPSARKRGPGVVVPAGLTDVELAVSLSFFDD